MHHTKYEAILLEADYRKSPTGTRHEVVCVMEGVAILRAHINPSFPNATYTGSILMQDGAWRKTSHYYSCADAAMLGTLGVKWEGCNSRFDSYAQRMLNIP
jgi:hypothetical protein